MREAQEQVDPGEESRVLSASSGQVLDSQPLQAFPADVTMQGIRLLA